MSIIKINKEREMIMKKILCLAMVLFVSVFFLISCSGGKTQPNWRLKPQKKPSTRQKLKQSK